MKFLYLIVCSMVLGRSSDSLTFLTISGIYSVLWLHSLFFPILLLLTPPFPTSSSPVFMPSAVQVWSQYPPKKLGVQACTFTQRQYYQSNTLCISMTFVDLIYVCVYILPICVWSIFTWLSMLCDLYKIYWYFYYLKIFYKYFNFRFIFSCI